MDLVQRVDARLRRRGLAIDGVAMVTSEEPRAKTTYHAVEQGSLRIDWMREPTAAEIRSAEAALREKEEDVLARLKAMPEPARREVILKMTAWLMKNNPALAREVGLS